MEPLGCVHATLPTYVVFLLSTTIDLLVTCDADITSKTNSQISSSNNSRFSIGSATVEASAACRASNHLPDCNEPGALPNEASLIQPNSSIHLSKYHANVIGAAGSGASCSCIGGVFPL